MSEARDRVGDDAVDPRTANGSGPAGDPAARDIGSREGATLLYRSAGGDQEAFVALYDATCSRVYGLAVRILGSTRLAEQVAHESYLEVWRTSARFDADRWGAVPWILSITLRRVVDRLTPSGRSSHRAPDVEDPRRRHVRYYPHGTREEGDLVEAVAWLDLEERATLQRACRAADLAAPDHLATILATLVDLRTHETPAGLLGTSTEAPSA